MLRQALFGNEFSTTQRTLPSPFTVRNNNVPPQAAFVGELLWAVGAAVRVRFVPSVDVCHVMISTGFCGEYFRTMTADVALPLNITEEFQTGRVTKLARVLM